jgi:hypothetical protein
VVLFEDKKVAFLLPAKTGSTTVLNYLKHSSLQKTITEERHLYLSEALDQFPQIKEYKVYCFVRNPAKRFASFLMMQLDKQPIKNLINVFKKDIKQGYFDFMGAYFLNNRYSYNYRLSAPQVNYFGEANVIALDFDDFDAELKKATQDLGIGPAEIKHSGRRDYESEGVDKQKLVDWVMPFVKVEYADDCRLWEERFGRRIDA